MGILGIALLAFAMATQHPMNWGKWQLEQADPECTGSGETKTCFGPSIAPRPQCHIERWIGGAMVDSGVATDGWQEAKELRIVCK